VADGVIAEAHAVESKEIKPFAEHGQGIFEVSVENGALLVSGQANRAGRVNIEFYT